MKLRPFINLGASNSWDEIIRGKFKNFILRFDFRFAVSVVAVRFSFIKNVNKISMALVHIVINYNLIYLLFNDLLIQFLIKIVDKIFLIIFN